jgi:hypothetical protein
MAEEDDIAVLTGSISDTQAYLAYLADKTANLVDYLQGQVDDMTQKVSTLQAAVASKSLNVAVVMTGSV